MSAWTIPAAGRIYGVAVVLGLALLTAPAPAVAITGPASATLEPVQAGERSYERIRFTVVPGEQVPPPVIEGSDAFSVWFENCSGGPPGTHCDVEVRFRPQAIGPFTGTLRVGDATVHLDAAAYGVGPLAEASPQPVSWSDLGLGAIDAVRRVTIANRGDAPLAIRRLGIGGRDRDGFAVTAQTCSDRRLDPGEKCRAFVRLRSFGGLRRGRLEILTELPGPPLGVALTNEPRPEHPQPMCPCAEDPGSYVAWSLGVIGARFAAGVVTDVYTSVTARLRVTVFHGKRAVRSRTSSRRLTGRQTLVVPGALRRGRYRLRVTGVRGRSARDAWWTLRVA